MFPEVSVLHVLPSEAYRAASSELAMILVFLRASSTALHDATFHIAQSIPAVQFDTHAHGVIATVL